jgi:porphobilinogen synthase
VQTHAYPDMLAMAGLRREHLICPLFVSERRLEDKTISSMPGMSIYHLQEVVSSVQRIYEKGISSIIVFGIPRIRDGNGLVAADRNGIVQRAVREIKSAFGRSLDVGTDVCVCQYNLSGHCGIVRNGSKVDNDSTIRVLADISLTHAEAGADVVAPSSMMDGQVHSIRAALDEKDHFSVKILSYSAKHASSLYKPFRSAAFARKGSIEKSSYQVSYASPKQTMREIADDIKEGADMVMVKPALAYLDLVKRAKENFSVPIVVQNVSGEYAMVKAAGRKGWIEEEGWKAASLAAMRRAGADKIISYFALDVAQYLK